MPLTETELALIKERMLSCIDMHMLGGFVVRDGLKADVEKVFALITSAPIVDAWELINPNGEPQWKQLGLVRALPVES